MSIPQIRTGAPNAPIEGSRFRPKRVSWKLRAGEHI